MGKLEGYQWRGVARGLLKRGVLIAAAMAAMVLALSLLSAGAQQGQAVAVVRLSPSSATTTVGGTVDVNIEVADVANLYGAQVKLIYDNTLLEVVDAMPSPGTQIGQGSLLDPSLSFIALNRVLTGTVTGTIEYAQTQLSPATPVTGTGTLAIITFQGKAGGTAQVNFADAKLAAPGGMDIPATTQNGVVNVTNSGALRGVALLEGRNSSPPGPAKKHADSTVRLFGISQPISLTTSTITTGAYLFPNVPAGTYTITIGFGGYLPARRAPVTVTAGLTTTMPTVTLLMGDVTGDGTIDIFDISGAAYNFLKSAPSPWSGEPTISGR